MSQRLKSAPRGVRLEYSNRRNGIEVDLLVVEESLRGRGLGTQAMMRLQCLGRKIILSAVPDNGKKTALHRFYRRLGFRAAGKDVGGNTVFEWQPKVISAKRFVAAFKSKLPKFNPAILK